MSTAGNAERIRNGYRAFNEADLPALVDLFAEEVVWHFPGHCKFSGDHIGRDATLTMLGGMAESSNGTYRAELHDVTASEDHAMGWATDLGEREGRSLSVSAVVVFRMKDGKVVEAWHHFQDVRQVEDFWA